MNALVFLINFVVDAIFYLVLAYVILSWLVAFNVVNLNNDIVRQIHYAINSFDRTIAVPDPTDTAVCGRDRLLAARVAAYRAFHADIDLA